MAVRWPCVPREVHPCGMYLVSEARALIFRVCARMIIDVVPSRWVPEHLHASGSLHAPKVAPLPNLCALGPGSGP